MKDTMTFGIGKYSQIKFKGYENKEFTEEDLSQYLQQ